MKRFTLAVMAVVTIGLTTARADTTILATSNVVNGVTLTNAVEVVNGVATVADSNKVTTAGPITKLTGDAVGSLSTYVATHGSVGAAYFEGFKSGEKGGGGSGPGVTETVWFYDLPLTSKNGSTNLETRAGLVHADIFTKTVTRDQLGFELSEAFFNQNIANSVAKWPVIGPLWKAAANMDIELTGSVSHNTDELANMRLNGKYADWGFGVKVVKLY